MDMLKSQFLSLALAIAGKLYDEISPAAPPVPVPPASDGRPPDERDALTVQRQAFYDRTGSLGQFVAFHDFVANHKLTAATFDEQYRQWEAQVAESTAERDNADKPYGDQGDTWKSVVAVENDDIDRNFNKLPYPAKFVYLSVVAPNRFVSYYATDVGKMIRDAFTSPLRAGWTQEQRAALRCDDLPYTGDASILAPEMDRDYYMLVLRKVGPEPYQFDNFKLPFGGLDLRNHGG